MFSCRPESANHRVRRPDHDHRPDLCVRAAYVTGELHRLCIFLTFLERREHAATDDRELYYLRTAQGWFYIAVGAFLAVLLALGAVLGD